MPNEEMQRARAELKRIGADWALLSSRQNVTYVSHFETPVEYGFYADFLYVPPMCLLGVNQESSALLVCSFYDGWITERDAVDQIVTHEVYPNAADFSPAESFAASLRRALREAGLTTGKARVAVETRCLPEAARRVLVEECPGLELIEGEAAVNRARWVKTARELDLLRQAAEVNRFGMIEFSHQCRQAGKHEFAVWAAVERALHTQARKTVYLFGDLIFGENMATQVNGPRDLPTRAGDMGLLDSSVRVNGYWSDLCNTVVVGSVPPTPEQKRYGEAAREAFYAAVDALRPGRQARQVWEAANNVFKKYGLELPHHGGHQVGTSVNEEPRLLPFDESVIEAGMVFCLEPGAYEGPGGAHGARLEKQVIVHASGPEIFPDFEFGF